MKQITRSFCSVVLILLLTLAGCGGRQIVTESRTDETFDGIPFERILVIGVADKITFRNLFEGELANQLRDRGIEAVPSYEILPYTNQLTRDTVLSAVADFGIDAVLITSLADSSKKPTYEALDASDLYVYYANLYKAVEASGKTASGILNLKGNLYDVTSGQMIWSLTSENEYKYKIRSLAGAASLVVNKLHDDGLI